MPCNKSPVLSHSANICLASMGVNCILSSGEEQDIGICLLLLCCFNQGVSAFLRYRFENTLLPCLAAFTVGAEESVSVLAVLQD